MAEDYDRNIDEIEDGQDCRTSPSFYVQNACVTDPRWRRPGTARSTSWCRWRTSTRTSTGQRERPRFRALVLQQLERIGLTDVEKRIRFEKSHDAAGLGRRLQIYRGATFNLAHYLGQMLHLRPRNRFEDLEGVYLVGGGTHPGSGLPVIYESRPASPRG